jgi:hypothetical protein
MTGMLCVVYIKGAHVACLELFRNIKLPIARFATIRLSFELTRLDRTDYYKKQIPGSLLVRKRRKKRSKMKFTLAAITALVAPIAAQFTTPAPTQTGNWFGPGGPWVTSDPAKWSSIYNSLVSDGRIPSTLTAAPWPTDGWGPGAGWGPGGGRGGGGPPGGHWGGTSIPSSIPHTPLYPSSNPHFHILICTQ